MIVDGKAIAAEILEEVRAAAQALGRVPTLTVLTCDPDFATNSYLTLKRKKAEQAGVSLHVIELARDVTMAEIESTIQTALPQTDGVIVQLPFPPHFDPDTILALIPPSHDADALNPDTEKLVHSPVVGAIDEILHRHEILVAGKEVLVVGNGRLVGKPSAEWFRSVGGLVTVVDKESKHIDSLLQSAEIVLLGAGDPGFVTPDMITEHTILLDAGTSESGGQLRGDADPRCATLARLFTPVPGGIGPITVAVLLRNVVTLARMRTG